jgi:hypothetical protein
MSRLLIKKANSEALLLRDETPESVAHRPRTLTQRLATLAIILASLKSPFGRKWKELTDAARQMIWEIPREAIALNRKHVGNLYLPTNAILDWEFGRICVTNSVNNPASEVSVKIHPKFTMQDYLKRHTRTKRVGLFEKGAALDGFAPSSATLLQAAILEPTCVGVIFKDLETGYLSPPIKSTSAQILVQDGEISLVQANVFGQYTRSLMPVALEFMAWEK